MMDTKPATIVIVEDNPGHARLIEKNIRRSNISNEIVMLNDGQKAADYLLCQGEYANCTRPSPLLVLLDLNLPVLDGLQLLRLVKSRKETRKIPIVVLTSSDDQHEISACYDLGCNVFITKPIDYEKFSEAIRKLGLFISVVTFPSE